jgi:adenine-specific DNA glycosylase
LEREIAERTGLVVAAESPAYEFHHTVTRFRIRLICVTADNRGGALNPQANFRWAKPSQFRRFALSMPARKFADRLTASADSLAATAGAEAVRDR